VLAVPGDPSSLPDASDIDFDEQGNAVDARTSLEMSG
jgi:hypothetical protein